MLIEPAKYQCDICCEPIVGEARKVTVSICYQGHSTMMNEFDCCRECWGRRYPNQSEGIRRWFKKMFGYGPLGEVR